MAYIETINKGKKNYYYLTQTIRYNDKFKKIRWFLAKGNISKNKLVELSKNVEKNLLDKVNNIKKIKKIVELDDLTIQKLKKIKINYKKIISSLSNIEYQVIEKEHLIRFTFNTNAIEGSTITLKETSHILEDGISPDSKSLREIHEIENTKKAYEFIKKYKGKINIKFIKKIHYILTNNILEENAGNFRRIQVFMGGAKHTPTKASEIQKEMNSFTKWIKNQEKIHPIILLTYVHHYFIAIHPFIDGNGRTGRLLLNYMLLKSGFPPICIKKEERIKYTDYLELSRDGDITKFLNYIIKKVEESYNELVDNTKYN